MNNSTKPSTYTDGSPVSRRPTVTVMGAGAVGGLLAAMLERSDEHVMLVAREATGTQIRDSGLTITSGLLGNWTSAPAVSTVPDIGATVLLAVKACGLDDAIDLLRGANPSMVIPVLNGIQHIELLREALPHAQVLPATITVEAQRTSLTSIEHRSPFVRLTVPTASTSEPAFESLTRAGVEVIAGGDEGEVLWRKYRFLAPMALLTASNQCALGEALEVDPELTSTLVAEVAAVATAAGLPTGGGELRAILESFPRGMRSSLQLDLASHRPNELEAIGGGLLAAGAAHLLPLPASARIVRDLSTRN